MLLLDSTLFVYWLCTTFRTDYRMLQSRGNLLFWCYCVRLLWWCYSLRLLRCFCIDLFRCLGINLLLISIISWWLNKFLIQLLQLVNKLIINIIIIVLKRRFIIIPVLHRLLIYHRHLTTTPLLQLTNRRHLTLTTTLILTLPIIHIPDCIVFIITQICLLKISI